MSIKLVTFLGNPGDQYASNRHNVGWLLAKRVPFLEGAVWRKKHKGLFTSVNGVLFLKPETYMNASGEAVQSAMAFYKLEPQEVLVVHDELDLPLGTISLKFGGGLNGHNGLRSLKACLNSADFWRLRIGIGRPEQGSVLDWVLSDFSIEELVRLAPVFDKGAEALRFASETPPEGLLPAWAKVKIDLFSTPGVN